MLVHISNTVLHAIEDIHFRLIDRCIRIEDCRFRPPRLGFLSIFLHGCTAPSHQQPKSLPRFVERDILALIERLDEILLVLRF